MRPLLNVFAIALVLAASVHPSRADGDDTVRSLMDDCRAPPRSAEEVACVRYIVGASDQLAIEGHVCLGATTTRRQEVQAFLDWADVYPERSKKPESTGVLIALIQGWQCKETAGE
jgi:hypothetical protein